MVMAESATSCSTAAATAATVVTAATAVPVFSAVQNPAPAAPGAWALLVDPYTASSARQGTPALPSDRLVRTHRTIPMELMLNGEFQLAEISTVTTGTSV